MKKIILTSVVILSLLNASFLDTVKVQNPISSEKEGSAGQELKNQLDKLNRNLEEVINKIKTKSEAISKYHKIAKQNKMAIENLIMSKAKCKNLEKQYALTDNKIDQYEQRSIDNCYKTYVILAKNHNGISATVKQIAQRVRRFMKELPIDKNDKETIEQAIITLKSQIELYISTK
jgi:uncharacterized protein YukE